MLYWGRRQRVQQAGWLDWQVLSWMLETQFQGQEVEQGGHVEQ
jgi:hypothetical protein